MKNRFDLRKKIHEKHVSMFGEIVFINKRLHQDQNPSGGGICCWYHPIPYTNTAYKYYKSMEEAYDAFTVQRKAFFLGVAPEVIGSPIIFYAVNESGNGYAKYDREPFVLFGYKTEIAKVISNRNRNMKFFKEEFDRIKPVLDSLGLGTDLTIDDYRNFGVVNQRLVVIDFGSESFVDW